MNISGWVLYVCSNISIFCICHVYPILLLVSYVESGKTNNIYFAVGVYVVLSFISPFLMLGATAYFFVEYPQASEKD